MVFSCQVMSNYQKKNILFVNELKFSALQTLMCYLKRTMISYINITHWHMIFEICIKCLSVRGLYLMYIVYMMLLLITVATVVY